MSKIDHPDHYGGAGNLYEAIRVIEAWDLNFHLGNVVKYISRAGKKTDDPLGDLRKAHWYLTRELARLTVDRKIEQWGEPEESDDFARPNALDEAFEDLMKC